MKPEPPKDAAVFESNTSVMWFDEKGILHSITKKHDTAVSVSEEDLKIAFDVIKSRTGGRKICWLAHASGVIVPDKGAREFASEEMGTFVKAMAIITESHFIKMAVNIFLTFKKSDFHLKLFIKEKEASEWLRQYLP